MVNDLAIHFCKFDKTQVRVDIFRNVPLAKIPAKANIHNRLKSDLIFTFSFSSNTNIFHFPVILIILTRFRGSFLSGFNIKLFNFYKWWTKLKELIILGKCQMWKWLYERVFMIMIKRARMLMWNCYSFLVESKVQAKRTSFPWSTCSEY